MWCAGIGWSADGFECVLVDSGGGVVGQPTRFAPAGRADLTSFLAEAAALADDGLRVVLDSTNGMLDASLLAEGFRVYRADPAVLPPRPVFGSADPAALARLPVADLTELSIATGTLTGLGAQTDAAIASAAGAEQRLTAAGRFVGGGTADCRAVALTFDDGPDPRYTPAILDILHDQ